MAQIHWTNTAGGLFSDAGDWSTDTVPGATDDAILDAVGGAFTVTSNTSETVNSIQLASNATLDITSGTFSAGAGTGSGGNAGTIIVGDNTTFSVDGGLNNTGTINIASAGNDTTQLLVGATGATLSGGGHVTLSDFGGNVIEGAAAADALTNANNTISGSGRLGNGQLTLINQSKGVIDATGTNAALTLNTAGETVTNAGLIEATGSAGLGIASTTVNDSTGGVISAGTGSHVSLQTADIIGGTLSTTGTGVIETVDRGSVLDGTTSSVANTGSVNILDNTSLTIQGVINNTGSINLNSDGNNPTNLQAGTAGVTLTGGGHVTLSDFGGNDIEGLAAADTLTNVNNTISGSGHLGNGQMTLVNQSKGVIDATGTGTSLTLDTAGETVSNAGLIEATGSAGLGISSTTVNGSTGGVISAGTGSHISLGTADIIGGALTTTGTGVIETVDRGSVLDGTTSTVSNAGVLNINDDTSLTIQGAITNTKTGSINLNSAGNNQTALVVGAPGATLTGGVVTMTDHGGNQIFGTLSGPEGSQTVSTLTNKTTIAGSGVIGETQMSLVNSGTIDATGGSALTIDTGGGNTAGSNTIANTGLLESTNPNALSGTGGLALSSVVVSNGTKGIVEANGAATHVDLFSSTISGGTLETLNGGVIQTLDGNRSSVLDGTKFTVNNAGVVDIGDNTSLTIQGVINNTGTINVASGGNDNTQLAVAAAGATLTGAGQVILSDHGGNQIDGDAAADVLTNVNNTISGSGSLGLGQMTLVNQSAGVIDATGTNASLTLDTAGETVTNAGLIEATGSAGLGISSTTINGSTGGVISAGTGSHVSLQSATIIGGTLSTTGTGVIETVDRNSVFDGSTAGTLNTAATVNINDNTSLTIDGVINNTGTINVASGGNDTTQLVVGAVGATLSGGGQVLMSDHGGNQIVGDAAADVLTNVNNTISGSGVLGGATLTLINQSKGVIDATGTNASLTLDTAGETVTNAGLIEATGSAGLGISSTTINGSTGGVISVGTGSHISLGTADIMGGTLTTTGTGVIETVDRSSVFDGSTAGTLNTAATVNINDNTSLTIDGVINNTGTINVASGGNDTTQLVVGAVGATLSGGGQVLMSDHGGNQIVGDAAADVLTNVNNTISGSGQLGANALTLINESAGVIDATGSNADMVLATGGKTVTNSGLIESTGSAGMLIQSTAVNSSTGGTVSAGAGSHISLATADLIGGTLSGAGVFQTTDRGTLLDGSTDGALNNASTVNILDNTSLTIEGTINNTGSINVASGGNDATQLILAGSNVTLEGGGSVTVNGNGGNQILGSSAMTLTNAGNVLSGSGQLFDGNVTLVNQSAGIVDGSGASALVLSTPGDTITNDGTLEGTGAGGLTIANAIVTGTGGKILAGAGSSVRLQASTVTGGVLDTGAGGVITIENGSSFTGDGTFTNAGTIALAGTTTVTSLIFDKKTTLTGGGIISLGANTKNTIVGTAAGVILTNLNNTIEGSGSLGDGKITLVNDAAGVIDADSKTALTIKAGKTTTITNAGLIEATDKGKGIVDTAVDNTGILAAAGGTLTVKAAVTGTGSATINGGTLNFTSSFTENVAFTGKTGRLELAQSQTYTGSVSGFSKVGKTSLDLVDIGFVSATEATFVGNNKSGVLTVTDVTTGATAHITLTGNYTGSTFTAATDNHGGTLVVANPTAGATPPASETLAAAPVHQFVAAMAGMGAGAGGSVHTMSATLHASTTMLARPQLHTA